MKTVVAIALALAILLSSNFAGKHFNLLSERRIRDPVKWSILWKWLTVKDAKYFCRKSLSRMFDSVPEYFSRILSKPNSMKFQKINNPLFAKLMNRWCMFQCLNEHNKYQINIWNTWSIFTLSWQLLFGILKVLCIPFLMQWLYVTYILYSLTIYICTLCFVFVRNVFLLICLIHPNFASFSKIIVILENSF